MCVVPDSLSTAAAAVTTAEMITAAGSQTRGRGMWQHLLSTTPCPPKTQHGLHTFIGCCAARVYMAQGPACCCSWCGVPGRPCLLLCVQELRVG